ncbi:MAG: bifunctional adenosylcobinamide kinase/adenosylcobinamide-phosphate guanylyltransferase [Ruminococcus sp.]|nr:bifunctional adenosylcobinamide kinase/adenosylcobinamide-phosphate guanylyltransferase [Ruminococcus sp.]
MIMITGGAYQGKTAYAAERFRLSPEEMIDGAVCEYTELINAKCVYNYHEFIKKLLRNGEDAVQCTTEICDNNNGLIVIMNEIGSGIIPLDREERSWREVAGRCGCIIAERSDEVIRMICGIPQMIKGGE